MQSAGKSPTQYSSSVGVRHNDRLWQIAGTTGALVFAGTLIAALFSGRGSLSAFLLAAAGLCLCTLSLLHSARVLTMPRLVVISSIDAVFLILFAWSMTQSMPVRIEVHGNTLTGFAADRSLTIEVDKMPGRQAGIYLADFGRSRIYEQGLYNSANPFGFIMAVSARTYPREGWSNLAVKRQGELVPVDLHSILGDGVATKGSWVMDETSALTAVDGGVLLFDPNRPQNLTLRGDYMRSSLPGGIIAGADSSGDGYVFTVDTERQQAGWYEMKNGEIGKPLSTTYYRHGFTGLLQSLIRTVSLMYLYALATVTVLGGIVLGAGRLLRSRSNREESTIEVADNQAGLGLKRYWIIGGGLIALLSLGVSSWVALGPLERIPHVQDEVAYLFQAKTFALGRLWAPAAPYPEFFQNPFILTIDGQWFSKYPPGHALMLAIGALFGQPWIIGPMLGAASLLVVFFIGKEVWQPRTGALAAFLGLTSPFVIFMSASYLAHSTAMFFTALFVLCYVKAIRSGAWVWAVAAGVSIGMAFITRQLTAVGVALPFIVFALFEMRRDWLRTLRTSALIVAGFLPVLVFLLLYNWTLTGSPLLFPHNLVGSYDSIGFGPGIGGVPEGHTPAQALWNTTRNLESLASYLFGWPIYMTFVFIALPFLLRKADRWDYLMLGGFVALVLAYLFWWAVALIFGPRYWYEALPFLLLLSARGIEALFVFVGELVKRPAQPIGVKGGRYIAAGLVCSLLAVLIYYNIGQYLPYQVRQYTGYNELTREPIRTVDQAGLTNAIVFYRPRADIANRGYGPVFAENSPLLDTSVIFARDLGIEQDEALLAKFPGRKGYLLDQNLLSELP